MTRFGQFGPTLADIKSILLFDQDLGSGTRSAMFNDVLRIDTESPTPGALSQIGLPHPANAMVGTGIFSRTAFIPVGAAGLFPTAHFGWIMWTDAINPGLVIDSPDDIPGTYPAVDRFGTAVALWCDFLADLCRAAGAPLAGIGLPVAVSTAEGIPEQLFINGPGYADPSDPGFDATPTVGEIIAGATFNKPILTSADILLGSEFPEEDGPGLTDQCPAGPVCSAAGTPYSDTELDHGLAVLHWDRFGNIRNGTNFLLIGVDGKESIYSDAVGVSAMTPVDPTAAGTVYDQFDDDQHVTSESSLCFGQVFADGGNAILCEMPGVTDDILGMITESQKVAGLLNGWTTDRGNGFSGIAGVVIDDWEERYDAGVVACAGAGFDLRQAYTLAGGAAPAPTVVLPFTFAEDALSGPGPTWVSLQVSATGLDTFIPFDAYVAGNQVLTSMDGYRDQLLRSYDRAGNVNLYDEFAEGNADHMNPDIGNVNMPTPPVFDFTTAYVWGGEVADQVDLKKTDFPFDFNSILGLQMYVDPGRSG